MAKILSFEPRPPGDRTHATTGLPAIVVIFPGVRYEKTGDADLSGEPQPGRADGAPTGKIQ